jgi:hypothetical protein
VEGRVVVSFRAIGGPGRPFLERARSLIERLAPLGAIHVGLDILKLTFALEAAKFPDLLELLTTAGPDTVGDEPHWAVGIAQGDLRPIKEEGTSILASGLLWSGPPFVASSALAGLARPGEILCAQTVPALRAGELVTSGLRIARDGTLRVRGARIDRRQPWKKQARENLGRLREPRLFAQHLPKVTLEPGSLVVVRADPGAGGSRFLKEIAAKTSRSLIVTPVGSGFEPFGALRRAFARSADRASDPLLLDLAGPMDQVLSGKGVSLELAAKLVTAFLWPKQSGTTSALIIDDAKSVDPATLEVCVRAARTPAHGGPFVAVVARLDATSGLPSVLAALPKTPTEHELPLLSREGAEDIAVGVTGGALDALARSRWARLGGGNPLAIVEAITYGIGTGDLAWSTERATPRSRAAGRGKVESAGKWIRRRANAEKASARALLSALAAVGGEANIGFLRRVLERAGIRIDLAGTIAHLERSHWIVRTETPPGILRPARSAGGPEPSPVSVAFPTRTHYKALFTTLEDDARRGLHVAIAGVIEEEEGAFGRVEGAWHAAQAGEGPRAAKILLDSARATADAGLEASTTQLIAFARRVDPSCEDVAMELLANALARTPSVPPPPISMPPATTPSAPPSAAGSTTTHASIPVRASAPPRSGPARVAAIASVRPTPRAPTVPSPAVGPPVFPPPVPRPSGATTPAVTGPPPSAADDEADSMVEHAVIVPPEEPDSMIEHARIIPPDPIVQSVLGESPISAVAKATKEALPSDIMDTGRHSAIPDSTAPGSQIAVRLGELAKEALLAADNAALERWVDGLRAAGESPAFTERMRAMAVLGRGDIGDALRVLRRTRARLDPKDHRRRCQTSLALGVALSVAGRPQDALLEAMDALARARQTSDERGAKACLAFLAKLYSSVSHETDAERLRAYSS